jgi:hypothetical protein
LEQAKKTFEEITKLIIKGMKKAKELGVEDMTISEVESYLDKKKAEEEESPD